MNLNGNEILRLRFQRLRRANFKREGLGATSFPVSDCSTPPSLTIITSFSVLKAALPVFPFAATSLDALVRRSVLAPSHAMTL